jgi:hypothetical protein
MKGSSFLFIFESICVAGFLNISKGCILDTLFAIKSQIMSDNQGKKPVNVYQMITSRSIELFKQRTLL